MCPELYAFPNYALGLSRGLFSTSLKSHPDLTLNSTMKSRELNAGRASLRCRAISALIVLEA